MAPDPTASFREREAESIFASEPRVPRTGSTIFGESNAFVASRLRELWPRRSDQFHVVQKKIWKAIEPYDWKEVWAVEFNNKVLAVLNTVSCFYVGGVFRRAVKLTGSGFGALNVLMPSIVGSVGDSITSPTITNSFTPSLDTLRRLLPHPDRPLAHHLRHWR